MRSLFLILAVAAAAPLWAAAGMVSTGDYPSVQAALDANPGTVVFLPSGEHRISEPVWLKADNSGITGHGTLVQEDAAAAVIRVEKAANVRIEGITVTRAEGAREAAASAILAEEARGLVVDGVRVLENHAREGAVELRGCVDSRIQDCEIRNYKRIAVDDRTGPGEPLYGYAFRCIDGTGIVVRDCVNTLITGNSIVERNLLPTREMKEQHNLGALTDGAFPTKPGKLGETAVKNGYVSNWHQGSAVIVTGPEKTAFTTLTSNRIENAAQGIDLHCDSAIVTGNTVDHGMMGIKATHGCRHLIISNNLLTHIDLWGILLNPGAASHAAGAAAPDQPVRAENGDGGTIIANNIITNFGYGHEWWNWGGASKDNGGGYAMTFYDGQLPENPPLTDVIIQGNMVYDSGRDGVIQDGQVATPGPRYKWAVHVGSWNDASKSPNMPRGLHFSNNMFHSGSAGVSNVPLEP